jgi:hypothetical protein
MPWHAAHRPQAVHGVRGGQGEVEVPGGICLRHNELGAEPSLVKVAGEGRAECSARGTQATLARDGGIDLPVVGDRNVCGVAAGNALAERDDGIRRISSATMRRDMSFAR